MSSPAPFAASAPGVAAYQARDLSKVYSGTRALQGVTLTVDRGETVALVGPSGAGKTTLLRLMAGMLPPSGGQIHVLGRPLGRLRPGKELTGLVGMMQQRLDLVPQLSVRNNVEAGLLGRWSLLRSLAGLVLPVEHPGARAAIERVGLGAKRHDRVARLSGGEQQRVALARVLVQDPAVILADEPVASLDPALAEDLLTLLTDIAKESGRTVIASLHSPDLARRHFARVVGLRDGAVAFDVSARDLTDSLLESVYRLPAGSNGRAAVPGAATVSR
ncbi:MAG: ATP-binding cassette domain-containing protein [Dehalococcoidia bacterium]